MKTEYKFNGVRYECEPYSIEGDDFIYWVTGSNGDSFGLSIKVSDKLRTELKREIFKRNSIGISMLMGSQHISHDDILSVTKYETPLGTALVVEVGDITAQYLMPPLSKGEVFYPRQYVAEIVSGVGKEAMIRLWKDGDSESPISTKESALQEVLKEASRLVSNIAYERGGVVVFQL